MEPSPAPADFVPKPVRILGFDYVTGTKTSMVHLTIIALVDRLMLLLFGREKPAPMPPLAGKTIAVSKIDLLGDVLMITPLLKELREQAPGCKILLVAASWGWEAAKLVLAEKLCDDIIQYDTPYMSPIKIPLLARFPRWWRSLRKARAALREHKTDIYLDLRSSSPNSLLLARLADVPHKIGFALRGFSYILQQPLPFDGAQPMGQQYLDALPVLGLQPRRYEKPVLAWRGEPAPGPLPFSEKPVLIVHPFSRNARKMIAGAWWRRVLEPLAAQRQIVVLGTKADLDNHELVDLLRELGCDLSLVGQTTFAQAIAAIRQAREFLGVDSVFAHVALAFDKPAYIAATRGASYRLAFPVHNPNFFYDEIDTTGSTLKISPVLRQYGMLVGVSWSPSRTV